MKILFMGTPEFAVESLRRLVADGHEICGVFTQPDKPRNRNKVTFSPVKEYALSRNLPVYQPVSVREGEALALVEQLAPELIVTAAYGRLLPEEILNYPRYGAINVHASLLPKYRGAAPINWAILNDEPVAGVSVMYMVKALDAGDVIRMEQLPVEDNDAPTLTARLAALGGDVLSAAVRDLEAGTAVRTPQDESRHTYASMLGREMSPIDWTRPARAIHCQIRGLIPWPCASTDAINGEIMKIYAAEETGERTSATPGTVVAAGKQGIDMACGDGKVLRIKELQAQGGKRMAAAAYLLGHPIRL
ncbi:methionyl-tRNA formyltransferase [Dysosmobacter sp.]|uniref:methionyl-tRNA formyltransferase n=1 Tax=Dysosmobacter sp. TaxID=2591382 RepID=UPI002A8C86F6|nr:methionyl-tRNA formyltransferase [Dysosmobacter sp.]MDY3282393.1 methionyl-tRNA formyltransferase [Dysosmobacter sp.]